MLLVIDIGNTDTTLGVFKGEELKSSGNMATAIHRTADEYATLVLTILHHKNIHASDIDNIVLCSVVPPLTTTYEQLCQQYFNVLPLIVAAGIRTGVRIQMDNPREVGADRIANAAAAHHLYHGPVIVADLGTATTFDTISKEGDYLGGAIAPGILTSAEALFTRASMLPRVELTHPKQAIGTNTISAIQSGVIFGYVGLIEGLVARIQQELMEFGEKATVVATGGCAQFVTKETSIIDIINPDLTLIGLRLIHQMNKT
jgi:type III pantothenate kinase